MRIRKLARQNATTTSIPQAHVCEFNQSPWDIMTDFSPPSSPMLLPPSPKVNENEMIESSDASISVMEWEECDDDDDDVSGKEFDCTDNDGGGGSGKVGPLCCKTDGKKWQCKREARYGNSLCEHHLALASKQSSDKKKKSAVMVESAVVVETEGGKKRVRTKKPKAEAANPYEMYYYSGFGPRWGKRRGEDKEDSGRDNNLSTENLEHESVQETSSTKDEVLDYIEDEDDDEAEDGFDKRKRARKPVKARSLKSLM